MPTDQGGADPGRRLASSATRGRSRVLEVLRGRLRVSLGAQAEVEGVGASEATCCKQWEGEFWEPLRPPRSDPSSPSAHLPPEQIQNQKATFRKTPHIVFKGVKTTLEAPDMVDSKLATKEAAPRFELGVKDLQSSALPLGHAADRGANSPNRIVSAMACPLPCWS